MNFHSSLAPLDSAQHKSKFDNNLNEGTNATVRKVRAFEGGQFSLVNMLLMLGAGLLCFVAAQSISLLIVGRDLLEKSAYFEMHRWSFLDATTALLSCVAGLLIAAPFVPTRAQLRQAAPSSHASARILTSLGIFICMATIILTVWFPVFFNAHTEEIKIISLSQEFTILLALIFLARTAFKSFRANAPSVFKIPAPIIAGGMVMGILLLLLEEISYGQHIFNWATPDSFAANIQNETNLHNFYTHRFELVYYSLAIFCFYLLPLLRYAPFPQLSQALPGVFYYVPPIGFALAALPLSSLLYESWSIVAHQLTFFIGFFIAVGLFLRTEGPSKKWIGASLASFFITTTAINLYGFQLPEHYEISEMRELVIAVYIAAYAIWLHRKLAKNLINL